MPKEKKAKGKTWKQKTAEKGWKCITMTTGEYLLKRGDQRRIVNRKGIVVHEYSVH